MTNTEIAEFAYEYNLEECIDGYYIVRRVYACPRCNKMIYEYQDRCEYCEQRVRWE